MCSTLATAAVSRSCSATWRSCSGSTAFGLGKWVFHWSKSIRNPQGFSGEMKHFGDSKFVTPGTDDEHQDLKDYESSKTENNELMGGETFPDTTIPVSSSEPALEPPRLGFVWACPQKWFKTSSSSFKSL